MKSLLFFITLMIPATTFANSEMEVMAQKTVQHFMSTISKYPRIDVESNWAYLQEALRASSTRKNIDSLLNDKSKKSKHESIHKVSKLLGITFTTYAPKTLSASERNGVYKLSIEPFANASVIFETTCMPDEYLSYICLVSKIK